MYRRTGIPMAHVPDNDVTQVRSTITAASLADAQKTVSNIRQQYTCQQYDAAYADWLAHKPKPVTTTKKVGGKTVKKNHHCSLPYPHRPRPRAAPRGGARVTAISSHSSARPAADAAVPMPRAAAADRTRDARLRHRHRGVRLRGRRASG